MDGELPTCRFLDAADETILAFFRLLVKLIWYSRYAHRQRSTTIFLRAG